MCVSDMVVEWLITSRAQDQTSHYYMLFKVTKQYNVVLAKGQ